MDSERLLSSLGKGDLEDALEILNHSNVDLRKCKDSRGYSALHLAALNGDFALADFLLRYLAQDGEADVGAWVNAETEEKFTALHLAAFKGPLVTFR